MLQEGVGHFAADAGGYLRLPCYRGELHEGVGEPSTATGVDFHWDIFPGGFLHGSRHEDDVN